MDIGRDKNSMTVKKARQISGKNRDFLLLLFPVEKFVQHRGQTVARDHDSSP